MGVSNITNILKKGIFFHQQSYVNKAKELYMQALGEYSQVLQDALEGKRAPGAARALDPMGLIFVLLKRIEDPETTNVLQDLFIDFEKIIEDNSRLNFADSKINSYVEIWRDGFSKYYPYNYDQENTNLPYRDFWQSSCIIFLDLGFFEDAKIGLKLSLNKFPDHPTFYEFVCFRLGDIAKIQGNLEEALEYYNKALDYQTEGPNKGKFKNDLLVITRKLEILAIRGELKEDDILLELLEKLTSNTSKPYDYWNCKGVIEYYNNNYELAAEFFQKSADKNQNNFASLLNKAAALKKLGGYEQEITEIILSIYQNFSEGEFWFQFAPIAIDFDCNFLRNITLAEDLKFDSDESSEASASQVNLIEENEVTHSIKIKIINMLISNPREQQYLKEEILEEVRQEIGSLLREYVNRNDIPYLLHLESQLSRREEKMAQIRENDTLEEYYEQLKLELNKAYTGAVAASSDFVDLADQSNSLLAMASEAPMVGRIFKFLNFTITKIREIRRGNEIINLTSIKSSITEWEEQAEEAAIQITLLKQDKIMIAEDQRNSYTKVIDFIKNAVGVSNEYDTNAKRLALIDATKILQHAFVGNINSHKDVASQFAKIVCWEELYDLGMVEEHEQLAAPKEPCSCVIMSSLIEYENPVLQHHESLLPLAYQIGGVRLVNLIIESKNIEVTHQILNLVDSHPEFLAEENIMGLLTIFGDTQEF